MPDNDEQPNPIAQLREHNKNLESQLAEAKSAREAAEASALEAMSAKRELSFVKAGVNPDDPAAKWFVKAYDGELSVEAIKAAATEARLLATNPPQQQQRQADLAVHRQISEASANATTPDAQEAYRAELATAKNAKQAMEIVRKYGGAVAGDDY
jgi:hypothetical protein